MKTEFRDNLIGRYQQNVEKMVEVFVRRLALSQETREELMAAAYLGLVEAAGRYDRTTGTEFGVYARLRIRGAIVDNLRSASGLSGRAYRLAKLLQTVQALREQDAAEGMLESDMDTRDRLGSVLEHAAHGAVAFRLSLEEVPEEALECAKREQNPELALEKHESQQKFIRVLETFPEKERLVLEQIYFNDRTVSEVAEEQAGMSKSWVSKLHAKGLKRLRARVSADPGILE